MCVKELLKPMTKQNLFLKHSWLVQELFYTSSYIYIQFDKGIHKKLVMFMIIHKGKKIGWNIKVMMKVAVLYVEVSKVTICVCPPIRTQLFCQDYQKVFKSLNCACCCILAIIVISILSFHINPFSRFLLSVLYSFLYLYLPFSICQLPLSLNLSVLFFSF